MGKNEDGYIATSALKQKIKDLNPYGNVDMILQIIDDVDLDNDGTIDYEEFLRALHPDFNETPNWFWTDGGDDSKNDEKEDSEGGDDDADDDLNVADPNDNLDEGVVENANKLKAQPDGGPAQSPKKQGKIAKQGYMMKEGKMVK